MQIQYTATQCVRDVIAALGRTEDVKFSPTNRRLAIAGFVENKIAVFDVCISVSLNETNISLTGVTEISSACLKGPHGLDFFDDETIVVANRNGDAAIFKLPPGEAGSNCYELAPVEVIRSGDVLNSPGSVTVTKRDQNLYEVFVCNNYVSYVTKHLLDLSRGCAVKSTTILLRKWLNIPDGVCVDKESQWIAISNHGTYNVYLYEYTPSLNECSEPVGILRCASYPHGLRFTPDGRFILVADAGAPYVHLYAKDGSSWRGVRNPLTSFKTLSDDDYLRGRRNPLEGGPKGIDIDNAMNILVATCEFQPVAFFDFSTIIDGLYLQRNCVDSSPNFREKLDSCRPHEYCQDQRALELRYELELQDKLNQLNQAKAQADAQIALMKNSRSWRITAPLRSIYGALRNLRGR